MDLKDTQYLSLKTHAADLPPGPDKLRAVIKELDVTKNPRYAKDAKRTWCNIFVTDVIEAFDFYPTHWMRSDGSPGKVGAGVELSANKLVQFLVAHGARYGWAEADKESAFAAAERGHLVVLGWDSGGAGSGHVAILLPEGTIAQAGTRNFVGEPVSAGFGTLPVRYFVQMNSGVHRSTP